MHPAARRLGRAPVLKAAAAHLCATAAAATRIDSLASIDKCCPSKTTGVQHVLAVPSASRCCPAAACT